MRSAIRRSVVLSIIGAVGMTACDGGGDRVALSREDWIKAANTVCGKGGTELQAVFQGGFPDTPEAAQAFLRGAAPVFQREVDALDDLEPPEADAKQIDDALALGRRAVADIESAAKDPTRAEKLFQAQGGENLIGFQETLVDYGADRCELSEEEDDDDDDGGEDVPDPAEFSAEKAAYITAGDALCATANETLLPAEDRYLASFPAPLTAWTDFFDITIPSLEALVDGLRALDPPAEVLADATTANDSRAARLTTFRAARERAAAGDQNGFDEEMRPLFEGGFDESDRLFRAVGFQVCGSEDPDAGTE